MSESLIIRLLPHPGEDAPAAQWLLVDMHGGRLGAVVQGSLQEALALAHNRQVILLIPGAEALHFAPTLPPARTGAKLAQLLPFALEDQLASDVDTLHFAAGKRDAQGATPVTVVSHDAMQRWLMPLRQTGITPDALYVDHALMPVQQDTVTVLVDQGQVSVRRVGQPLYTLDVQPLHEALLILVPADEHAAVTLYVAEREYDAEQAAMEAIRERTGSVQIKLLPEGVLPLLALHAMQDKQQGEPHGAINLMQGPYTRRTSLGSQLKPWRYAAMLAGAALLLHVMVQSMTLWQLRKQETRLDQLIQQTYAQAMGGGSINANDARRAFEGKLIEAQNAARGSGLMLSFDALAGSLTQTSALQIDSVVYRNDHVDVQLSAPSMETLEQIRQQAQTRNLTAEIQSANPKENRIEGHLQFKLPPGA